MTDEFEIDAIAPEKIFINGKILSEADALDTVDDVIKQLRETDNIELADIAEDTLIGLQRISGKALAKLLYEKSQWWQSTNQEELRQCKFEDYEETKHGMNSVVLNRYLVVWEKMSAFPPKFWNRPIRDLIPVAKALEQGYELSKDDWKELIQAEHLPEIGAILRRVKGKPPRKSSLQIVMERDGTINAYEGKVKHFVGYLDVKNEQEDETVKKAIARLIHNSGIRRK